MKRICSLFLCFALGFTMLLSACGKTESSSESLSTVGSSTTVEKKDPVTLKYYFIAMKTTESDLKAVEEEINKITVGEINAKIELHPLSFNEYPTKIPLILTTGDDADIVSASSFAPYSSLVQTNGLKGINDILQSVTPDLWKLYDQERWDAAKVKGSIYMVANYDPSVSYPGFWSIGELTDKYKFDWQNATQWEDWEPYFDKIIAQEDGVTPILSDADYWGRLWFPNYYGYDSVGNVKAPKGQPLVVVKADDKARKIIAAPFTEDYKNAIDLTRKWYEKGFFLKTPPTEAEMMSLRSGKKFASFAVPFAGVWDTTGMAASEWGGAIINQAKIKGKNPIIGTGSITSSGNCVTKASKNPEVALKFIELLHTNADIHNLMNWGIEGKHWEWKDKDNKLIKYAGSLTAETTGWNVNSSWQFGNKRLQYFINEGDIGTAERVNVAMKDAVYSSIMGFVDNPEPIKNQLAALSTVCQEYAEPLERGLVDPNDPNKGLAAFQNKLKDAGIDEVVAEYQRQIDAWAAENSK